MKNTFTKKDKKLTAILIMIGMAFSISPASKAHALSNTIKGCKGSPTKISISNRDDANITFSCSDGCNLTSEYTGYSEINIGSWHEFSSCYELVFETAGTHFVTAYDGNGERITEGEFDIRENHDWKKDIGGKKWPTCGKSGSQKYECTICRSEKTEEIPPTGEHKYDHVEITKQATCSTEGEKTYTCVVCESKKVEKIPKTENHKYDSGTITIEPTCVKEGEIVYKCLDCGEEIKEIKNPTGIHEYDSGTITKESDCENNGEITRKCKNCEKTSISPIFAKGHDFSEWKIETKPTALSEGKNYKVCKICSKKVYENTKKLKAKVSLNEKNKKIKRGKRFALKIKEFTYGDYVKEWRTSNKKKGKIVSKSNQKCTISANKKGKFKVILIMKSGCKATCNVTVK